MVGIVWSQQMSGWWPSAVGGHLGMGSHGYNSAQMIQWSARPSPALILGSPDPAPVGRVFWKKLRAGGGPCAFLSIKEQAMFGRTAVGLAGSSHPDKCQAGWSLGVVLTFMDKSP